MKKWSLALTLALLAITALTIWGCGRTESPLAPQASAPALDKSAGGSAVRAVMAVQDRHTPSLMLDPDVIGTATTFAADRPAIMILVLSEGTRARMPRELDGVPVVTVLTDRIVAMGKPTKPPKVNHTDLQTPPIQLGTSGGWRYDLANGYCCGGTLGSLIQVGNQQRILSNYHVLEADIVSGGNNRVASNGDYVIQPGLIDVACNAANAQNVATLVVSHSLPSHNVDCSSATVVPGMVRSDGAILEVGTLSAQTAAAYVDQAVKKSGRTTGLTRSKVSGLNASVSIAYENECAGGAAFTKTFTGQILIANRASKFLGSGDSGSLMVEDVTADPRAVGLLFAGSSSIAVANPIDEVLSFLNASMVGN